jgi:hypothetical protein
MAATTRPASRLAVVVLLVLLVAGCAGKKATSTATAEPATTATTVAATTTTVPPLTAEELAWLKAVTKLRKDAEKAFSASTVYLTRAKMTSYANALRACSRELARIGAPGDRLQPVYVIMKKACAAHDKGAKCFAQAASVSMADGGVVAGTPQEKTQRKALDCAGAAQGDGSNLLIQADSTGEEIKADAG